MRIQLLHFEGCPSWRITADDLTALAEEFDFDWELVSVGAEDDLTGLGFRGSPTLLVDGTDPFADDGQPFAFACRVYATPQGLAGSPSRDQLREMFSQR